MIITIGCCVLFGSIGYVQDYFGDRRIALLPYLAFSLMITGIFILLEPVFETKFMRAWNRWILRYATTLGRVKRNLYGGVAPAHNPDLHLLDYLNETEKCICISCHWIQPKRRGSSCVKCGERTESRDRWKWLDEENQEISLCLSEDEFQELWESVSEKKEDLTNRRR